MTANLVNRFAVAELILFSANWRNQAARGVNLLEDSVPEKLASTKRFCRVLVFQHATSLEDPQRFVRSLSGIGQQVSMWIRLGDDRINLFRTKIIP